MGRRTRGRDLWGGLALQGSFFVPDAVLVDVLVDLLTRFQNNVPEVPSTSLGTPIGLSPSPFQAFPVKSQRVPNRLRWNKSA